MNLKLLRFSSRSEDSLGLLFINGRFVCFTLEDEKRQVKVQGETRIPNGVYPIALRTTGGFHSRYAKRFGCFHKGMLHLLNVPHFKYVLIHILNDESETDGWIGVGDVLYSNNKGTKGYLGQSTQAYKRLYTQVSQALLNGESVTIDIQDIEEDLQ